MNQSKYPFNHQLYPNITTFILSTELAAFKLKISLKDKTFHRCHKKFAYHEINFREAERASFDRWLLADSAQGVCFPQIDPKFKIQSFDFAYSERNFS